MASSFSNPYIITQIRALGIRSSDISDSDLVTIIEVALDEWNRYRPNIEMTNSTTCLVTVADQPNYSMPTGALWITSVCWNPGYDTDVKEIIETATFANFDAAVETNFFAYYKQLATLKKYFGGHWDIINDEIYLSPTPTQSGTKVAVFYATENDLSDLNVAKDNLFKQLVHGLCLERMAMDKSRNVGFTAGAYKVDKGAADQIAMLARDKLKRVRNMLAAKSQCSSRS